MAHPEGDRRRSRRPGGDATRTGARRRGRAAGKICRAWPGHDCSSWAGPSGGRGRHAAPPVTILDAYAVIAFLRDEPAADEVRPLLDNGDARLTTVGVAEVLDHLLRLAKVDE